MACTVLPAPSVAQSTSSRDGSYEARRLELALTSRGWVAAKAPEGKRIAFIEVVRSEVFERGELWPDFFVWFNRFHWLTREAVVRRELTMEPGERFSRLVADETMRNLRQLGIFALVRVSAVQAQRPDEVGVVVFTRDLWSLRLETELAGAGESFQLAGQLTERNLFGNNTQAAVRFAYRPITMSVGEVVHDYRMLGQRLELYQSGDLIYNHRDGQLEGGVFAGRLGQPFYRLSQRFAFDLVGSYRADVHRDLDGVTEARVDLSGGEVYCDPAAIGCAWSLYDQRLAYIEGSVHYRRGVRYKQIFTAGFGMSERAYSVQAGSGVAPQELSDFKRLVLPRSRRSVYPFARYRLSLPDFAYFQNLSTFGTTESVQRGPRLDAQASLPLAALGSTYNAFVVKGLVEMVWAGGDGLLSLTASGSARLEQGRVIDQALTLRVRGATPSWFGGRFVVFGKWVGRRRDTARTFVALGGDSGLRGYPAGALYRYGAQLALANFEYRTLPVELASVHIGGVLFWDMGSVHDAGEGPRWHHGAGAGLRVLLPQLNSYAFRFDLGAPVGGRGFSVLLSYGGAQAVPLTAAEDLLLENNAL